jgi:hypothetical protein
MRPLSSTPVTAPTTTKERKKCRRPLEATKAKKQDCRRKIILADAATLAQGK